MWYWIAAAVVVATALRFLFRPRQGGIEGRMRDARRDAQNQSNSYRQMGGR